MNWFRRHTQTQAYVGTPACLRMDSGALEPDPLIRDALARSTALLRARLTTADAGRKAGIFADIERRADIADFGGTAFRDRRILSHHRDPLTGLPNRDWLMERVNSLPDDAGRDGGGAAALLLIGLDRFKAINHTLGYLAGDQLLLQIAERLRFALPRGAEAARLGGDEFAVVLPVADSTAYASRVAANLVAALGSPLDLGGLRLVVEAGAGVAVLPEHALDARDLLRRATAAMHRAKRERTGVEVYEPGEDSGTPDALGLLGDLRRALDRSEVELHYQPKIDFDGRVVGLEALMRWVHPERGDVPPDAFLTLAESTGLMPHLTEYVLETALAQIVRWRAEGLNVPVAVNVSARDVGTPGFADSLAARLTRHGVPPEALRLEMAEHIHRESRQRVTAGLTALTGLGVKVALDDFGNGHWSPVDLRRLPVSELKIGRSLVARLAVDTQDAEIVRCTVDLAHSLGLVVVAVGVEDEATWERLEDLGCDAVQGWLIAAAMPPEGTTDWLRRARAAGGLLGAREHRGPHVSQQQRRRPAAVSPAAADDAGRVG